MRNASDPALWVVTARRRHDEGDVVIFTALADTPEDGDDRAAAFVSRLAQARGVPYAGHARSRRAKGGGRKRTWTSRHLGVEDVIVTAVHPLPEA